MNPTQTGIAVAVALALVSVIFIVPGLWPFGAGPIGGEQPSQDAVMQNLSDQQNSASPASLQAQPAPTMESQQVTQLSIKDEVVGTGAEAKSGDTVTVNYVGSLLNGKVFDASANHGTAGFSFTLGKQQVIEGWDKGLLGMKEGGKRLLVIPATMGYGNQSVGGGAIPPNSALIFEVELLKVKKGL